MSGLIRHLWDDLTSNSDDQWTEEVWVEPDAVQTGTILGYFGRVSDKAQIREAIVKRYGTRIKTVVDPVTGQKTETYTKAGFVDRMLAGHIETVSTGLGHKITSVFANLFSEPGQKFALVPPTDSTDVSELAEYLDASREGSNYLASLVEADEMSVQLGSSIIWLEYREGAVHYRVVDPGKVAIRFDGAIESDGKLRPVNYLDLEDATCVIIETGTVDALTKTYVAIFARSYKYPLGRYVVYKSAVDGKDVPDVGSSGCFDWRTESGDLANPLSWYAEQQQNLPIPEYPLVILLSGQVQRDRLLPISTSLLEESIEADIAASHLRAIAGDNARGTLKLMRSNRSATLPLPESLRGDVVLYDGDDLDAVNTDSRATEVGWSLLREQMVTSAQGWSVPDYYISSEDHTIEAASGVALQIRAIPLKKARDRRVSINAPSVSKLFEIEKALNIIYDKELFKRGLQELLEQCSQTWDPGELNLPEPEKERIENIKSLTEQGLYDTIEALKAAYRLPSDADAVEKYEALKQRAAKYPPLKEEPVSPETPFD